MKARDGCPIRAVSPIFVSSRFATAISKAARSSSLPARTREPIDPGATSQIARPRKMGYAIAEAREETGSER